MIYLFRCPITACAVRGRTLQAPDFCFTGGEDLTSPTRIVTSQRLNPMGASPLSQWVRPLYRALLLPPRQFDYSRSVVLPVLAPSLAAWCAAVCVMAERMLAE